MTDTQLPQEMEMYAVIVAVNVEHRDLETSRFLKVVSSFVCRKELDTEDKTDSSAS